MIKPWEVSWTVADSAAKGALQGATMGWGDEIQGAVGAAYARMMRPDLFQEPISQTYTEGRDIARSKDQQAAKANPKTYIASEIGGGLITPMMGMGSAPTATRMAAVGAGYGAGAGAGYSEAKDMTGIMTDAAKSAAIGGVVTPAVGKALEHVAENPDMLRAFIKDERGMFGGVNAVNANKETLALAEKLTNEGADPKAIWKQTGWFKGVDGKWRFEIDDSGAALSNIKENGTPYKTIHDSRMAKDGTLKVGNILSHDQLAQSYPDTLETRLLSDRMGGSNGSYNPQTETMSLGGNLPASDVRSTTLHELQHAIQQREGFAYGGSPEKIKSELNPQAVIAAARTRQAELTNRALDDYMAGRPPSQTDRAELAKLENVISAHTGNEWDLYNRLAGEAESRLVEARMNMTPEQRAASFPPDMYDVPAEKQIVHFRDGEMRSDGENPVIKKAIETWGLTRDPAEAAYILPDGRMIDGSGKAQVGDYARNGDYYTYQGKGRDYMSGQRVVDHREISQSVTPNGGEGGTQSMHNFIRDTNSVRYQPGVGASFMGMPTDRQIQQLIKSHKLTGNGDPFVGDVYDSKGNWVSEFSIDVPSGAKLKQQLANAYTDKDPSISGKSSMATPVALSGAALAAQEIMNKKQKTKEREGR